MPHLTNIRALQAERKLELHWDDGSVDRLPYKYIRGECPCASCIEEWSGRRILDLNTVPDDVHPTDISIVGNYALKIVWSDGHSTGLYTWDHLGNIARMHGSSAG